MTLRLALLFTLLIGRALHAQAPGPLDGAAGTITPRDLRARIGILADDSMMGRDTPSPGLERAAAYVVSEFRRLGLGPAGERGTYIQPFGVSRWTVDTGASELAQPLENVATIDSDETEPDSDVSDVFVPTIPQSVTATPKITLPPTDATIGSQAPSNPGFALMLVLLAMGAFVLAIGFVTPVPAHMRARNRR